MGWGKRIKLLWELYPQIKTMDVSKKELGHFFELLKHFDDLRSIPTTTLINGTMLLLTSTSVLRSIRPNAYDKYHHQLPMMNPPQNLENYCKLARLAYRSSDQEVQESPWIKHLPTTIFHSQWNPPPGIRPHYFAIVPGETQPAIVVSVRGSDNLDSVHMNCEVSAALLPLSVPLGVDRSLLNVHSGVLNAAVSLVDTLEEILSHKADQLPLSVGCPIVFTGHSLGGSIAAVASAIMADRQIEYSNRIMALGQVNCFVYGSFPCISRETLLNTRHFEHVNNVVNGDDVIPRLRIEQLWKIAHCLRVYATDGPAAMLRYVSSAEQEDSLPFPKVYMNAVLPSSRVLHLSHSNLFEMDWKQFERLSSSNPIISSAMISHHLCSSYMSALGKIFARRR